LIFSNIFLYVHFYGGFLVPPMAIAAAFATTVAVVSTVAVALALTFLLCQPFFLRPPPIYDGGS
jgi:hypothetical protein